MEFASAYNTEATLRVGQVCIKTEDPAHCRSHVSVYKLGHVFPVRLRGESPEELRQEIGFGLEALKEWPQIPHSVT